MNHIPLTGVYAITLTAPDGRKRKTLAFLPTEQTRRNFLTAAAKRGLKVSINENENRL